MPPPKAVPLLLKEDLYSLSHKGGRAAGLDNLCPHFHLSMQSGCDETLKRMNRKYSAARFYESVALLRRYFDASSLTQAGT